MLRDRLVAHRGYQRKFPENTLLAMAEAVAAGARYLETDIQLTRDLVPVLYHDALLTRVSGTEGSIHDLDRAAATGLPAFEPYRLGQAFRTQTVASLASFGQFLAGHADVHAFIEIKEESIARFGRETVLGAVTEALAPVLHQAVIISFDVDIIAMARRQGHTRTGIVLNHWSQVGAPATRALAPDYLFANLKLIPHGEDLSPVEPLLVVYEIDRPAQAVELFDRGADMVETFDIGGMLAGLASHSL